MADGDFNLATIWASIVPETSKVGPAMEEAGKEAKGRFGTAVAGIGSTIHDDLEKVGAKAKDTFGSLGSSVKDIFSRVGKEGGESLTDSFTKAGSDSAKSLVGSFSSAEGPIGGIADKLGGLIGSKLGDAIHNLDGPLKSVGIDIGEWTAPIQDVVGKAQDFKGQINQVADMFKGLPEIIGASGTAIEALAGPLGILAGTMYALKDQEKAGLFDKTDAQGNEDWWKTIGGVGGSWLENQYNKFFHGHGTGAPSAPSGPLPPGMGGIGAAGSADQPAPSHYGGAAGGGGSESLFGGGTGIGAAGGGGSGSGSASSAPSGFSGVPLVQNPDGTWTSPNPAWAHLIKRESGGNPSVFNNSDGNAVAGDPSQGLFQFTRATWARSGGLKYGPDPSKATPQQQAEIAANLIRANPSGSDWGAGMSGRESASGLLGGIGAGGAVSAGSSTTDFPSSALSSRGGGGLGSGGGLGGGGMMPTGAQHDPIYTTQVDDSAGGGSSPVQSQGEQLGKGFVGGLLQAVGLDGSVFHTFNGKGSPLDFGAVKMGMGLINGLFGGGSGGGLGGGSGGGLGGGMAGGGGGLGGMLPGLGSLIPHPDAMALHGDAPGGGRGEMVTHHYGDVVNGQLNFTNNGNGQASVPPELKEQVNAGAAGRAGAQGIVPNSGPGIPGL